MGCIDHYIILVGHIAVERHSLLVLRHLLHTAHKLVLRQEDGQSVCCGCLAIDVIAKLVTFGQASFHCLAHTLFLLVGIVVFSGIFLAYQVLYRIAVHTDETQFLILLLRLRHGMNVKFTIHQQHVIAFLFGSFYVSV